MRIAEIYESIQGEGRLTNTPSTFVRASGCNLRCWYCDTPYASWQPEGEDLSVPEILEQVESFSARHVVMTGGEPMLFSELVPLCDELASRGYHVTIETAGTLYLPLACHLMSISPKLSNSSPSVSEYPKWHRRHERTRHQPHVIQRLIREYDYQLKFVVASLEDCEEVLAYVNEMGLADRDRIMLMPEGKIKSDLVRAESWLKPVCAKHGFTFCPRKQIEWFGPLRGT